MTEDPRIEAAARAEFNRYRRRPMGRPWSKLHWNYRQTYLNTARVMIAAADKVDPLRSQSK